MLTDNRQGAQGQLDAAPKNILSAEFDTENEDEVITKILQSGNLQQSEVSFFVSTGMEVVQDGS